MEIVISLGAEPALIHPEMLTAFSVRVIEPYPAEELAAAFGRIGLAAEDGEHVFVEQEWIRRAADASDAGQGWSELFAKMLIRAYAHGWVDAAGRVRAHIVRVGTRE